MPYPDLPPSVKSMLAREEMRVHHHLWHFVRSRERWDALPEASRRQLSDAGWVAPRFEDDPGSGLDFLGMHREMIAHTNHAMVMAADSKWTSVTGWAPIPWSAQNDEWPVPDWPAMPESAAWARRQETVDEMRQIAEQRFTNDDYLETVSLDQLGSAMEWSIHGWMHLRWSGPEPTDPSTTEPSNDWLFVPWSSHVNRHFWKLHGWIDERIGDWERVNATTADLSSAWSGPPGAIPGMPHTAEVRLMRAVPPRRDVPVPMGVKQHIIEGVKSGKPLPWGKGPEG